MAAPTAPSFELKNMFGVESMVAVVTGGGTGIGLMITLALLHNGAEAIYILGRRKEVLDSAVAAHAGPSSAYAGRIIPLVCDVTSKPSILAAVDTVSQTHSYINLLVCNAGVTGPVHTPLPTDHLTSLPVLRDFLLRDSEAQWASAYAANTTAVFFCTMAFALLLAAGTTRANLGPDYTSSVVTVSSIAAHNKKVSAGLAYSASKAGATHLSKMLGLLLVGHGIRCNVIAPGIFPSEMTNGVRADDSGFSAPKPYPKDMIPGGKPGEPEDMGAAILYLAGRGGKYLNGHVSIPDGGRLMITGPYTK